MLIREFRESFKFLPGYWGVKSVEYFKEKELCDFGVIKR